jgi:hypothetical protein
MNQPKPRSVSSLSASNASKLPDKPSAEFLRKLAKDRLHEMRAANPAARLFEAQLQIARDHGFESWRDLIALLNAGQRGNVLRKNARVEIEGLAPMTWGGGACTYLAAMANVLRVVGPPHDYVRLMGDSALAFRLRLWSNDAFTASCPSSPIGEMPPWTGFTEKSIGWTMRYEARLAGAPNDSHDMSDQLDQVTASIDAGLPVLGYFKYWDMGLAYGYEGTKLLVRDCWIGDKEGLVDITDCRGLFAFFEQRTVVPSPDESARSAIARAVARWSHPPVRRERHGQAGAYYLGADAYDRWLALLNQAASLTPEQRKGLLQVHHWTFTSLHDARQKAALYLRSVANLFPASVDPLAQAADVYQKMDEITGAVLREGAIFPAFYKPEALTKWTPDVHQKEIELLTKLRGLDQQAIALLAATS